MQKIDPEDIRKGDKIRVQRSSGDNGFSALEYTATQDAHRLPEYWRDYTIEGYYLLERPEPPFEPYWGMVIGDPMDNTRMAVYLPLGRAPLYGWLCSERPNWITDEVAKQKIAEGWVIIEKPEGVK